MSRFFISDLHFGHKNVIHYCNRPYGSVWEMNTAMIEQWNSQVSDTDEVYFLGDFGIKKKKCLDKKLVSKLNGIKYIILGNHDAYFEKEETNTGAFERNRQLFIDAGWSDVFLSKIILLNNGHTVHLKHFPVSTRIADHSGYNMVDTYLHGHQHGRYLKKDNLIDVSFDSRLSLFSEEDIINISNDKRSYIPSRVTNFYNEPQEPLPRRVSKQESLNKIISNMHYGVILYVDLDDNINMLENVYSEIKVEIYKEFHKSLATTKKELGLYVNSNKVKHAGALFHLLDYDRKKLDEYIIRKLKKKVNKK